MLYLTSRVNRLDSSGGCHPAPSGNKWESLIFVSDSSHAIPYGLLCVYVHSLMSKTSLIWSIVRVQIDHVL